MNKPSNTNLVASPEGLLLLDKPKGMTSFNLVRILRKQLGVQKIGHAGTLDPFATGVMVMMIGRNYTRLSDQLLSSEKEYLAEVYLGKATDTYDSDGAIISESSNVPTLEEVLHNLSFFQGKIQQAPPMYSAKKIQGKKLYELARKGIEIERAPVEVQLETHFIKYEYPFIHLRIVCSKGTYIRSIAHELGLKLGCGAHLTNLRRTRSGIFHIDDCIPESEITSPDANLQNKLQKSTFIS